MALASRMSGHSALACALAGMEFVVGIVIAASAAERRSSRFVNMVMAPRLGCFLLGRPDTKHSRSYARGRVLENIQRRLQNTPHSVCRKLDRRAGFGCLVAYGRTTTKNCFATSTSNVRHSTKEQRGPAMVIILCLFLVALWLVFSKFKLVRWGWLSATISPIGGFHLRNIFRIFLLSSRHDDLPRGLVADGQPRFHSLTSPPCSPSTGSLFGTFTSGIVFSALAWFSGVGRVICIGGPGG